jgi:hypothetical protein
MKLPELKNIEKYVGLYVVDFGDHTAVGFTAREVAELLESEKFSHCKPYKIHKAYPDGRLELKGVQAETFQLEMGIFFYACDEQTAKSDFEKLVAIAVSVAPPCRAKVQLAKYDDEKFAVALIHPAEYNDEISNWLMDAKFKTTGSAEGGVEAVQRYYDQNPEILNRHQLCAADQIQSRSGEELLANIKVAVQR